MGTKANAGDATMTDIQQLTARELHALRQSDTPPLCLDVRTLGEYETAAIDLTHHIPMQEIAERIEELPQDRHIVVICHHGVRSMRVALYLRHCGFTALSNLAGGIDAWSVDVDGAVPRY